MARGFMSIILSLAMLLPGCKAHKNTDDIDGGVVRNDTDPNAPKVIESQEITSFECEASFIATVFDEESELEGRVYKFRAVLEDGTVKVSAEWRDRSRNTDKKEFEKDASFMAELQQIVNKHNLAQHNGYSHFVSGLPDMYGEVLHIEYASGEYISASDNQGGFMAMEALTQIHDLFYGQNTNVVE